MIGYDKFKLEGITDNNIMCARNLSSFDLYLSSFAVHVLASRPVITKFHRTVINVGPSESIYNADIVASAVLNNLVKLRCLSFILSSEMPSFDVKAKTRLK